MKAQNFVLARCAADLRHQRLFQSTTIANAGERIRQRRGDNQRLTLLKLQIDLGQIDLRFGILLVQAEDSLVKVLQCLS